MTQRFPQSWAEFLNPDLTRPRIIAASVYIAGFEALKSTIIDRIRDFFSTGFDASGPTTNPKYRTDVLSRNRSPVYASLDWLKEQGAVDDADLSTFEQLKCCRNKLAHELLSTLWSEGLPSDFYECLPNMVRLLRKVEIWWVVNFEVPVNPDFDGQEVNDDDVIPGTVAGLQMLLDIALGDEEQSRAYEAELKKHHSGTTSG